MLPKPDVGQLVRVEGSEDRFVIREVSPDGGKVELVSQSDPKHVLKDFPCIELLLVEDESAD